MYLFLGFLRLLLAIRSFVQTTPLMVSVTYDNGARVNQ